MLDRIADKIVGQVIGDSYLYWVKEVLTQKESDRGARCEMERIYIRRVIIVMR